MSLEILKIRGWPCFKTKQIALTMIARELVSGEIRRGHKFWFSLMRNEFKKILNFEAPPNFPRGNSTLEFKQCSILKILKIKMLQVTIQRRVFSWLKILARTRQSKNIKVTLFFSFLPMTADFQPLQKLSCNYRGYDLLQTKIGSGSIFKNLLSSSKNHSH